MTYNKLNLKNYILNLFLNIFKIYAPPLNLFRSIVNNIENPKDKTISKVVAMAITLKQQKLV